MNKNDHRPEHLGWIESARRREHADLPDLRLVAQSHYGPPDRIAFMEVHGVDGDRARRRKSRRKIRADAGDLLHRLGYRVEIEPGRDVYDVRPVRPASAHHELRMLGCLRTACGGSGAGD